MPHHDRMPVLTRSSGLRASVPAPQAKKQCMERALISGGTCITALWRVKGLLRQRRDHPRKLTDRSLGLEIHRRCFPAVLFNLILNVLPFIERAQSRALHRGDANEHVAAARLRLNEAIPPW